MKLFQNLYFLAATCIAWPLLLQAQTIPSRSEQRKMLQEEQAFLQSMKPGLQHSQMLAVREGIAGNTAPLEAIRRSRNTCPTLPQGVTTTDITPNMRLFRPSEEEMPRSKVRRKQSTQRRKNTTAPSTKKMPILLYLHGGGWCFGSINSCANFCAAVAKEAQCYVVALNYRLSPEHPYPVPLADCQEAFAYLKQHAEEWNADTTRISIAGDSAGGNLALATAMSTKGVYSVIPIYPVMKLFTETTNSWTTYALGYGDDAELLEAFNEAYAQGQEKEPFVSVGLAPDTMLRQLPPVLFISAGHDILADQGRDFIKRLKKLGISTKYHLFPTATHLFITVPGQPTAFHKAVQLTAKML